MAVRVVHVSDVSDKEGSQEELGALELLEHPDTGEPARLGIFPDEFERLQAADRIVGCAGPRRAAADPKS